MVIAIDASRANILYKTGPEWYSFYLIKWLAKIDKENEYILYSNSPLGPGLADLSSDLSQIPDEEEPGFIPEIDAKGFQKIKSPHNNFKAKILKWPFRYFWTQGRVSLEILLSRPDVLFVPAHVLPIFHPRKSIVTIHDIGYDVFRESIDEGVIGSHDSKAKRFFNFIVRLFSLGKYQINAHDYLKWSTEYAFKKAKRIIVASNYTKEDVLKTCKKAKGKISVVKNGYNADLYKTGYSKEDIEAVKESYGIEGEYIFYIGRIERKKNIANLVEAYAILKDRHPEIKHKLVLAGKASYGYDNINYAIREFDLVDDVILTGWVKESDVPLLFAGADLFVFPSSYEGFGLPLLQAMACGVPIIASEVTSIPEVAKDAALFFNPQYALTIADSMAEVLTKNDLRDELVRRGLKRAEEFSWEKTAQETLNEINKL